jgi:hypothetical protein
VIFAVHGVTVIVIVRAQTELLVPSAIVGPPITLPEPSLTFTPA